MSAPLGSGELPSINSLGPTGARPIFPITATILRLDVARLEKKEGRTSECPVSCDCVWVFFFCRPHILAVTAVVIVGPWAVEFFTAITIPLFFYYVSGVLGCDTPAESVQRRRHAARYCRYRKRRHADRTFRTHVDRDRTGTTI